ncbi:MAG: hypothetical protein RLN62_07190 [Rickettsiales bacterium]
MARLDNISYLDFKKKSSETLPSSEEIKSAIIKDNLDFFKRHFNQDIELEIKEQSNRQALVPLELAFYDSTKIFEYLFDKLKKPYIIAIAYLQCLDLEDLTKTVKRNFNYILDQVEPSYIIHNLPIESVPFPFVELLLKHKKIQEYLSRTENNLFPSEIINREHICSFHDVIYLFYENSSVESFKRLFEVIPKAYTDPRQKENFVLFQYLLAATNQPYGKIEEEKIQYILDFILNINKDTPLHIIKKFFRKLSAKFFTIHGSLAHPLLYHVDGYIFHEKYGLKFPSKTEQRKLFIDNLKTHPAYSTLKQMTQQYALPYSAIASELFSEISQLAALRLYECNGVLFHIYGYTLRSKKKKLNLLHLFLSDPFFNKDVLELLYQILAKDKKFLEKASGESYYNCALESGNTDHVQFVTDNKIYMPKKPSQTKEVTSTVV